MKKYKIGIVHNQIMVLDALKISIEKQVSEFSIIPFSSTDSFFHYFRNRNDDLHVILYDLEMPSINSLDFYKSVKLINNKQKIIFLALLTHIGYIDEFETIDIAGILIKNCTIDEMVLALKLCCNDHKYYSEEWKKNYQNFKLKNVLSKREKEIIKYIIEGKSSKQIAEILSLSIETIGTHRKNIFRKTKARENGGLIKWYKDLY